VTVSNDLMSDMQ